MPGAAIPRLIAFLLLAGTFLTACAQAIRINELSPNGVGEGWVELLNADDGPVELEGVMLVRGSYRAIVHDEPPLKPGELRVLHARTRSSGAELLLELPARGGDLLLFAAGGTRLLDAFSWGPVPLGISIGRLPDGAATWSYLPAPSPGATNRSAQRIQARAAAPHAIRGPEGILLTACSGCIVTCTTDGSTPRPGRDPEVRGPVHVPVNGILRAVAWRQDLLPSVETWHAVHGGDAEHIDLCIDPHELHDAEHGLLGGGDRANHARSGPQWVRPARVALPGRPDTSSIAVRMRLSGSGSRSLPKRSYNLSSAEEGVRLPLGDGSAWHNVVLRADATPHALLRNLFATEAVRRAGGRLDVQHGRCLPLTLNGEPQGLYRLLPAKNEEFLLQGTPAEHLDIMEGPEGRVVKGDRTAYAHAMDLLARRAPLDTLRTCIEVESLIELACFDLYTGRADHDLNMRCWRPAQPGGRWRWVLYDMDLWAPPDDPSTDRIATTPMPAAPYLQALLDHAELAPLLLARLAVLHATVLGTRDAPALVDSLFGANSALMRMDHALWQDRMRQPEPEDCLRDLRRHAQQRPGHLLRDVSRRSGAPLRTLQVHVPPVEEGLVLLDGIVLSPGGHSITAFAGAPLLLEAMAAPGMRFAGWKGRSGESRAIRAEPGSGRTERPQFTRAASGRNALQ